MTGELTCVAALSPVENSLQAIRNWLWLPNKPVTDEQAMGLALREARAAAASGEVPVGAVVLKLGAVIGVGRNCSISCQDPTGHAEIMALRAAARHLGDYRLDGCELFVTLEPCAMCAGAMLHSRLARVVFGAADPKTGVAGSVIDLFGQKQLNHRTRCLGGVLEAESAHELRLFFQRRREAKLQEAWSRHRLRDDALRTPAACFRALSDFPSSTQCLEKFQTVDGFRLHYFDERPPEPSLTFLCLHGHNTWSYWWRHMLPVLQAAGHRVVAPDLIGFGKSDKPKKESFHSFDRHRDILLELVRRLDLRNVVLVVQGMRLHPGLALPLAEPSRFSGVLAVDWEASSSRTPGDLAPYPDAGHSAALRAFRSLAPSPEPFRAIDSFWRHDWQGQTMLIRASKVALVGEIALENLLRAMATLDTLPQHPGAADSEVAEAAVRYFRR